MPVDIGEAIRVAGDEVRSSTCKDNSAAIIGEPTGPRLTVPKVAAERRTRYKVELGCRCRDGGRAGAEESED